MTFFGLFLWVIAVSFFLYEFFLRAIIGSLSTQIIPQLHLSAEQFALLETGYAVAYGLMQLPVGFITDSIGLKRAMTFAILGCALAVFLFSLAQSFHLALFSRILMGISSSFSFICLLLVVISWLPKKYFAFFTGLSQFVGTLGPIFAGGPLIIILIATHESWRHSLVVISLCGLALALLTFLFIKENPDVSQEARWEITSRPPLSNRLAILFKNKRVWLIALFSATSYAPITLITITWGIPFLIAHGLMQTQASEIISMTWISYAICCPLLGLISDLIKKRIPLIFVTAVVGLATGLGICFFTQNTFAFFAVSFLLIGFAAAGQNLGFVMIAEEVDPTTRASALGLNNAMLSLFIAASPLIVAAFLHHKAGYNLQTFSAGDFHFGFLWIPFLYVISLIMALLLNRRTVKKA